MALSPSKREYLSHGNDEIWCIFVVFMGCEVDRLNIDVYEGATKQGEE